MDKHPTMDTRTWTDQPAACANADVLASLRMADGVCEIRRERREPWEAPTYLVTRGNLFGSQTLRVRHADDAFRLLDEMQRLALTRDRIRGQQPPVTVPAYAELL